MAGHHEDNLYESDVQSGGHGESFQRNIAVSLLLRMAKPGSSFRMAYEMKMADKFDDVVLIDDGCKEIHFLQAKHGLIAKGDKAKDIDVEALFPTASKDGGNFDLCMYLKSYLAVNHRFEEKEKEKHYTKKYYLITNRALVTKDNEWVMFQEQKVNDILHFPGPNARHLKLNPKEKAIKEMCNYINTDIDNLKKAIVEFFKTGMISSLFYNYCTPLKDVFTIENNKCRFSVNFSLDSKRFCVAKLRSMFEDDDMEKEVSVENNFLKKESKFKFLPPYVSEDEVRAFFRDFTLCVGQPNDLRKIIDSEVKTWMKSWIRPDILGGLGTKELDLRFTALNTKFEEFNKPLEETKLKRFVQQSDMEQCFGEMQCEMEKFFNYHVSDKLQYINRRIRFEKNDTTMENSAVVCQISDTKFVKELGGYFKDHQHIILVADPGMGKTSLLQFVAFEAHKENTMNVFLVYFSALVEELNKLENVLDLNVVLCILSTVLSEENCDMIRNAPDQRDAKGHSILLVLDAFDEIHAKYTTKVTQMIEILGSKKSIQFVISSRMHVKELLEQIFQVSAMFLEAFREEDQISYLRTSWNVPEGDKVNFVSYSKCLLRRFHSRIPSKLCEISGLPLMMKMLAEIYSDKYQQFLSRGKSDKRQQLDGSEYKFNISQLYEQFVRKCFHKKLVEKYQFGGDLDDPELDSVIAGYILDHQLLAMNHLDKVPWGKWVRKFQQFHSMLPKSTQSASKLNLLVLLNLYISSKNNSGLEIRTK